MPELPEVETIRLGLQKYIVGHKIKTVDLRLKKMISGDIKKILDAKILDVRRFGKGLVIDLDNKYSIAIHIKLTGQLIYRGKDIERHFNPCVPKIGGETLPNKWTHVVFKLDKEATLYYNDVRQFGWLKIIKTDEVNTLPFFRDLGPEPPVAKAMEGQANLTREQFSNILSKGNLPIKALLLDQKRISGIGNIYSNDALFDAQIDPRRKAKDLSKEEVKRLYDSILKVLKKGLKYGGATELNFVNVLGEAGGYQEHFLVYSRQKEPCMVCGTPIQKIKLGGRGTYFCKKCQK